MNIFENAKWIWANENPASDEFAEFYEIVDFHGKEAILNISADSNYAVYVNGALAAFGQYPDFPYDKVYDARDISRYMRQGRNVVAIRVWYYGIDTTSTYYRGEAGVIYSLLLDGAVTLSSSAATPSRVSPTYIPHKCKIITVQLGLSFEYDSSREDAWMFGEPSEDYPFTPSHETGVSLTLRPRTCLPVELAQSLTGKPVPTDKCTPVSKNGVIFDLGREDVGFICLDLDTAKGQTITVAFGEHLEDGHVRSEVGGRSFTFIYHAHAGRCYFMSLFRRFGCRYVEIIPEKRLASVAVSLRRTVYPVSIIEPELDLTPIQRRIYDACVHTLTCCMHEHYEDCPWREQALYTMDSRNQMLAGYYAFGEKLFPKANLELIAADNRPDGLLSICYPINRDLVIPSFSLHFILESEEYLAYTGDVAFIEKIYPKLKSVLAVFLSRQGEDGLIPPFAGVGKWNFYEWRDGLDGHGQLGRGSTEEGLEPDVVLNALLALALHRMSRIEAVLGIDPTETLDSRASINRAINATFYDSERGVYRNRASEPQASQLGNSLAILSGAAVGEVAARVADAIVVGGLVEASLSMYGFVYDALLSVDRARYSSAVLENIERIYTPMIEYGNGTVWETELGAPDFDNAGSLCHGWSAIPICYYHELLSK